MNDDNNKTRWWVGTVYLALLACAIPWYWPADDTTLVFGLPAWVAMAIAVSTLASIFTAWVLLTRPWPEADPQSNDTDDE